MSTLAFLQNIGFPELIIILAIILLVFGASRVPQVARSLGKSVGEFKKGLNEGSNGTENKEEKKDDQKADKA